MAGIIDRATKVVGDPDYFIPDEVRETGGLKTAQEIMRQFGELKYTVESQLKFDEETPEPLPEDQTRETPAPPKK